MEYTLLGDVVRNDLVYILPRPNTTLFECEACGCAVSNTDKHDAWHENQSRVADDASWGGMMRPLG